MQPCNEGETASTATWSPDGHHIAIICNGKSPRDLEAAKAEKTKTGSGKTGDEEAKGEKPLESKVIVATRSRFYDDSMARPWSPERRAVLIDQIGRASWRESVCQEG